MSVDPKSSPPPASARMGGADAADLEILLAIGRKAAELVLRIYRQPFEVSFKGPNDPVTQADREANELICASLEKRFPGTAILAEESVPADPAEIARRASSPRVFFVDPLDGTREFASKNGEFAVMIGRATEGRADIGLVVLPTTGEALAGAVTPGGRVAFLESPSGARSPLTPSRLADPAEARLLVSRSHTPKFAKRLAERLGTSRLVPCGSVGVKVARVARGEADLYVHGGAGAKKWDTCAPEAILVAAGGRFTDLDGEPQGYAGAELAQARGIVASNGPLHEAAVAAARALRVG